MNRRIQSQNLAKTRGVQQPWFVGSRCLYTMYYIAYTILYAIYGVGSSCVCGLLGHYIILSMNVEVATDLQCSPGLLFAGAGLEQRHQGGRRDGPWEVDMSYNWANYSELKRGHPQFTSTQSWEYTKRSLTQDVECYSQRTMLLENL